MRFLPFTVFYLLLISHVLQAQEPVKLTGKAILFDINYGIAWSAGDLSDRFGRKNSLGTGLTVHNKSNIQYGLAINYFFGTQVKEDVLSNLANEQGNILGTDGFGAVVFLRDRGVNLNFNIGKVFNLKPKSKTGIRLNFGAGLLQHWIRIQDETTSVPQIAGAYRYGYDRKTRGISFNQFIGYQILSNDDRINFFGGIECHQAFTKNIRPFNFSSQMVESQTRKDLIFGLKAGIILPFYTVDKPDEIFY